MRPLCVSTVWIALLMGCSQGDYSGYKWRPYSVKGVGYVPMEPGEAPGYVEEGVASHYRESWLIFPGRTALGEKSWDWSSSGAHKTLPLPCRVRVTNLRNGRSTVIRLNDRGPFIAGRNLDVTGPVAKKLGFHGEGLAPVRIEVLSVGDGRYKITRPRRRVSSEQAPSATTEVGPLRNTPKASLDES
jgi:rare lipoprotein A